MRMRFVTLSYGLRQALLVLIAISLLLMPVSVSVAAPTMPAVNMEEMVPCPVKQSCCDRDMTDCVDPFVCVSPGSAILDAMPVQLDARFSLVAVAFPRRDGRLTSLDVIPPRRPPRD